MARKNGKDRGILEWPPGSKIWFVRIYVNGKEKRFACDNKSQAKDLYGRLRADIREGKYFPEKYKQLKKVTLKDWINSYIEGSTNRGIAGERHYGKFWSKLWGMRSLDQVTTEDCRKIQAKLLAKGRLKPASINRRFSFLRHLFNLAIKDKKLVGNPVSEIKFFPEAKRTRFLIDIEIEKLRSVMHDKDWDFVGFAIETGLRREEQFKLRWDEISFETSTLTVPLPKGGKSRIVPLSDSALEILRGQESIFHSPWVFPKV